MAIHHILVRDFTTEQKRAVEHAADAVKKSTSKFCRDACVKAAGGKVAEGNGTSRLAKRKLFEKAAARKPGGGTRKPKRK